MRKSMQATIKVVQLGSFALVAFTVVLLLGPARPAKAVTACQTGVCGSIGGDGTCEFGNCQGNGCACICNYGTGEVSCGGNLVPPL